MRDDGLPEGERLWEVFGSAAPDEIHELWVGATTVTSPRPPRIDGYQASDGLLYGARLVLTVAATDRDDAIRKARDQWKTIRAAAHLFEPAALTIAGVQPVPSAERPWDRLVREAGALCDMHPDFAVVRSQTAVEIAARSLLDAMFRQSGLAAELIGPVVRPSLADKRSRSLVKAVTGVQIGEEEWWPEYRSHLDRRHAIVHQGLAVSTAEARRSVAAAGLIIRWLLGFDAANAT